MVKMAFRSGCCKFVVGMTMKLLERNPLNYSLARHLSCLCPKNLSASPDKCSTSFKKVLEVLLSKKHFTADQCDQARRPFTSFCDEVVKNKKQDLEAFKERRRKGVEADRLDELFAKYLAHDPERYGHVWEVVKFCLTLSHGQAVVESGFSLNKDMLVENQLEDTLVAQRCVHNAISHKGNMFNIVYVFIFNKLTDLFKHYVVYCSSWHLVCLYLFGLCLYFQQIN
jgi:hypothetical protein